MNNLNYQYFITQSTQNSQFQVWLYDEKSPALLKKVGEQSGSIPKGNHLIQVGNYLLQWSLLNEDGKYNYRLLEFNPEETNPLGSFDRNNTWTSKAVQSGTWEKRKFFGSRSDFANPQGASKGYEKGDDLVLVSMHNFVLNWIPTAGRGTYHLFNFDHGSSDPLPAPVTPQGAWLSIEAGHELMYINGYVFDWEPQTGDFTLWQFDAQNENPLSFPAVKHGNLNKLGINTNYKLVVMGTKIIAWDIHSGKYLLLNLDIKNNEVLTKEKQGTLPKEITENTVFTAIETLIPANSKQANKTGTIDYMRSKIKHVIYYMIENRSFDHVCGWLYEKNNPINVIGPGGPFRGVDKNFTNTYEKKKYPISKYNDGKLPEKQSTKNGKPCYEMPDGSCFVLDLDQQDPYHDYSDVMRQMFSNGMKDYKSGKTPDMGGFALNNGTPEVMMGYSPEQLPVLNGLAKHYAISDDWFCSMPGGTDVNRAFSLTGSSLGHLNNFQNGVEYTEWWEYPHRPSIWKVLWSNGITDFKIYNAVEWIGCQFTYNLFLKGQIPSIDGEFEVGNYAPQLNQFYDDLKYGTLPKFAYLEPKWVASAGSTSYHPGNDLIPGERTLNDIYNAIQASPLRDEILLVITFDEHGGLADHMPPPPAVNPFVNDNIQGFNFDIMGVRIPTILTSPWISKNTVFRSDTGTSYDSTSILATLLEWFGIPKSRWGLGERTNHAPTFEAVVREKTPRKDSANLTVPWDSNFPKKDNVSAKSTKTEAVKESGKHLPVHGLHELVVPRMVADMTPNLSRAERVKLTNELLASATNLEELHAKLDKINKKHSS